jgi:hypothetical protein
MIVRIYWSLWILTALSSVVLFLVGGFSMVAAVVYGTIAFGLIFMGMIGVLPNLATHPTEAPAASPKPEAEPVMRTERIGVLKSA